MPSHLLAKAAPSGREIVEVTPERAGWTHIGFRALRLGAGETETVATQERELCLVVLTGTVDVTVDGQTYAGLGQRDSVFDPVSPAAVYVPSGHQVVIQARRDAELALCSAPCDDQVRQVRLLDSQAMRRSVRGQGSNTRYVCDILPHDDPTAAHLLVVEVLTPEGFVAHYGQTVVTAGRGLIGAAVVMTSRDLGVTEACLAANGVHYHKTGARLVVAPEKGQGVTFAFEELK